MSEFNEIVKKLDRIENLISSNVSNRVDNPPNWFSVKQCADYLNLGESSIRKMIASGSIPFKRLPTAEGGAIRFNRKQIDLWLLSGEVKPTKRTRQALEDIVQ